MASHCISISISPIKATNYYNQEREREREYQVLARMWRDWKPSHTAGGNHFGKPFGSFSKKLNTELPYDPATPLLDTYTRERKTFT